MPKLVKLNNINQTDGQFENIFHEPITIEKNAKVALLNACVEIDLKNIEVTDQNHNGIQFKTADGLPANSVVHLTNGIYTASAFVEMLEARMNATLVYQPSNPPVNHPLSSDVGFQWKVSLDSNHRINIIYDRNARNGVKNYDAAFVKNINVINTNYTRDAVTDWNAGSVSEKTFCEGASLLEFTRRTAGNVALPEDHQHIIGLLPTHYEEQLSDFTLSQYHYAVINQQIGGNWVYVCKYKNPDGTFGTFNSNVQPADHIVGLMLTGGRLLFYYRDYTADFSVVGNITVLHQMDWNYPQHLYGGFSIYTAGSNVKGPKMWSNPYDGFQTNFENYAFQELAEKLQPESSDPNLGAIRSRVRLILNDEAMKLLGFDATPPLKPDQRNGVFLAIHPLPDVHIPENLKVILNNVRLDSYDGIKHRRENILLSLPILAYQDSKILYDRAIPIYLDLKNTNAFTLNSVDISILDFNDNPIKMLPYQCDMTLLFDD